MPWPFLLIVAVRAGWRPSRGFAVSATRPSNIRIDIKSDHLVHVTFAESVADDDIEALFASVREVFRARRRVVLLVDASNSGLSASQRKLLIGLMREHEDEFRRWVQDSALVVRSALARGTLTALLWMMKPPYEQKVFSSLDDALSWTERCTRELESAWRLRAERTVLPRQ